MKRGWLVGVAVAAALGGGIALGAVLFGDDDGGDPAERATETTAGENGDGDNGEGDGPSTTAGPQIGPTLPPLPATTVPEEGLTGDALELAQAINRAHQLTYHIVLRSLPGEPATEVEIWRRPPQARRDARLGEGDAQLVTSEFRSPEGGHLGCLIDTSGTGQTTCLQAPPGAVDPLDPTVGAVDPTEGTVTASDDTVGGIEVRCFSVAAAETHLVCFDADGIPAVVDGGDGRLERVGEPEIGIPDDVFVPPDSSFIPSETTGTTAGSGGGGGGTSP